ncbi:uncharacterized protein LOC107271304 [Cephus cinctus]|uniref:Small ribosomal subunit protein mS38 n=1 Tax=Cephus cinctus TaxID=211228 RepID=A0AAJ7C6S1_CEPCN|nr:uncharacterized protein LOC107271304 [Cephus cinctus]
MALNALCKTLQRLDITRKGGSSFSISKYHTMQQHSITKNIGALFINTNGIAKDTTPFENELKFSQRSINIDFDLPTRNCRISSIIEFPISTNLQIGEPPKLNIIETIIPEKSVDLPPIERNIEKQAARLIVIRRKKMKKHQLRKLRKRMRFEWAKVRQRRELKKEKAFQAELLAQIDVAEKFDAKAYVASRIHELTKERLPKRWRGEILPESMIRQFIQEKKARKEAVRNRPRIKL